MNAPLLRRALSRFATATHYFLLRLTPTMTVLAVLGAALASSLAAETSPSGSAKWESDIATFERADRSQPPPTNAVLFVGSSSIRMWKTLSNDFAGIPIVQRGFGGSQLSDSLHFAPRIVLPYAPRLVVVYAGDNDIAAGKSAQDVFTDYKALVGVVQQALPKTRVAFIAIKPSLARWKLIDEIRSANDLVKDWSRHQPLLSYIDIATPMLGPDGKPRPDLFLPDGLHLNAEGYKLWTKEIRPHLLN